MENEKQKFKNEFEKRLIVYSLAVIKLCTEIRKNHGLSSIGDQLIRSGTSIGANVIEAKGSGSTKDYARFFEIALKSAQETKYWLILVNKSIPNLAEETSSLLKETEEIAKIIGASLLTMRGKR